MARYDAGSYTYAVSEGHKQQPTGAHTDAFDIAVEITDDECDDEQQQQQQPDQATTAVTSDNTTVTSAQSVGDTCVVSLMAPCDGVALVPCGHSRFCGACALCSYGGNYGQRLPSLSHTHRHGDASVQFGLALNSSFYIGCGR